MRSVWKLRRHRAVRGARLPLPPQQLTVMATALSVAAVIVSLVMVAGGVEPATVKTTECNVLLGKHWSSYQYFRFVWCEGSQIQCNTASNWCLGIFLDICDRGIFRQCCTRLEPLTCLQVHCLSPSKWTLFISLALRVLLFLLLVVAGDVERNRGPPKSSTSEDDKWKHVANYELSEDDVYDVNDEVFSISRKWMYLARWFKLPHSTFSRIGRKYDCNADNCLFAVLQEWLGTAKDDQRHGHPSWQVLVKAVAYPAGGNNRALAEAIAQKYSATADTQSDTDDTVARTSTVSQTHPAQAAVPTSVVGDLDIDPRKERLLSREFSAFLNKLGTLLEECTDVDVLKCYLGYYAHPLYPNKLYVERHVYSDAQSVGGVLFFMYDEHINYTNPHILYEIADRFDNAECKHIC